MTTSGLSRREFLKLAGIGLAGVGLESLLAQYQPAFGYDQTDIDGKPSKAAPRLKMNSLGAISGGAFLMGPNEGGGIATFINQMMIIDYSGLSYGWQGSYYSYNDLEDTSLKVRRGVMTFRGRLPGTRIWYRQVVSIKGKRAVKFSLSFSGPGRRSLDSACFSFSLPVTVFKNKLYQAGRRINQYPETVLDPEGFICDRFKTFATRADLPAERCRIVSPRPMSLNDMRIWDSTDYDLDIPIPVKSGKVSFTLTAPTVDSPPNPPALRFSHVGYLPGAPKWALLEIDERDKWTDLNIYLENETEGIVATGILTPILNDFRKQFAIFDFSYINTPGNYRLAWNGITTPWFRIEDGIYDGLWQLTLDNFLPFEMCHVAVDLDGDGRKAHGACHLDDAVQVPPNFTGPDGYVSYETDGGPGSGADIPLSAGGWHDAGDYDLNMYAQPFVVHELCMAWEKFHPDRDVNTLDVDAKQMYLNQSNGKPDILEQIEWGARWLLSMQNANGQVYVGVVETAETYGSSVCESTDGIPGTGDERQVYVSYHSDVQLKFAIALSAASRCLTGYDDILAGQCWQAAQGAWEFFRSHSEVYRPTVYFHEWAEGREQMILAAAAELYLTDPQQAYLDVIAEYEGYLNNWPGWPAPRWTSYADFWYAAPFLARVYPSLPEGGLRDSVYNALVSAASRLREQLGQRPFSFDHDGFGDWGISGDFLALAHDAYWLHEAVPDEITLEESVPAVNWLFGLHPVEDFTYVFGTGFPEPQYHYSGILIQNFGEEPASIPGAVIPGVRLLYKPNVMNYNDWPNQYCTSEACIYDAATFIFVSLAFENSH